MDPLSTSASIITALQALGVTIKGVRKLWKLRNAPRELVLLQNEVLRFFLFAFCEQHL